MNEIVYRDISAEGPVEDCRELCNALMRLQADRSVKYAGLLRAMNFENRLQPSFEAAEQRFLCVAYDAGKPVGYIFCEGGAVTERDKSARPDWAAAFPADAGDMYPAWLPTPTVASHLNNLYVLPEYRGRHIGGALMERGMAWLRGVPGVRYIFVHVSDGNDAGALYQRYGFRYSHSVYGGMIAAYLLVPERSQNI